ncbi:MAG: hypothetical protein O8C63_08230 [Candidatus Methanoperedens sp.]|nr:hypothetical protein [Candidatus Methanoperedens sp.]
MFVFGHTMFSKILIKQIENGLAPASRSLLNTGDVPLRFVTVSVRIARDKKDDVPPYIA